MILRVLAMSLFVALACEASQKEGDRADVASTVLRIKTPTHRLVVHNHRPEPAVRGSVLVILLHGDTAEPPPEYHIEVARGIAARHDHVTAAAILRPGYADGRGNVSSGETGRRTGDNYTPDVVDSIADAIAQVQEQSGARRTLLIGHSGGGAVAALVAARRHGLLDQVIAVGCPCDLSAWQRHMRGERPGVRWERGESLSPIELAGSMDPRVSVLLVVGSNDRVVPPAIGDDYAGALREQGVDASVERIDGAGHNMLTHASVAGLIDREILSLTGVETPSDPSGSRCP
jgi:pimeloyl-ACP methyl ester carboxylesterase